MKKGFSVVFALFTSLVSFAQYDLNFEDNLFSNKEKKQLEQAIDFQLSFYKKVFPDDNIKPSDVKVTIYSNYGSYVLRQEEAFGKVLIGSGGFYSRKNKEAVVLKKKDDTRFLNTCYHELSHFFTNTYFEKIPIWLNEGLATYFDNVKITSKGVKPEIRSRFFTRVKTMIDIRDLNISEFMGWDGRKFNQMSFSHDSYGYALGHCIVWFLMDKDPDFIPKLIQLLRTGKSSQEAMDELYEGGFKQFEEDFVKYVQK